MFTMTNFKNQHYTIENFIEIVKEKKERSEKHDPEFLYFVYCEQDQDSEIKPAMTIYVGDVSQVSDDYLEMYPDFVEKLGLSKIYSSQNFQDVVDLAVSQKQTVSNDELIECLNYYNEHDDFLDID